MGVYGRSTVYNSITSPAKLVQVNPENQQLSVDFIEYLESVGRSKGTITQYTVNLNVFWCWNLEYNNNKSFINLTKREFTKFQNHAINEWGWSPKRIRTVKSTLSSLSNYIQNILDDEYTDYKPVVRKIESPADVAVRIKAVFTIDEIEALLDKLVEEGKYMRACVLALAVYSGRRKAELTRFKVSYFTDDNLICSGALYKTPEKMVTKGMGVNGKLLDVYTLAKPFKPYLDLWLKERERLGIKSDWLFPLYKNGRYTNEHIDIYQMDSYANYFASMLDKPFYFHSMRHLFTTYLLEQNLPESVVQTIIGWTSSDMVRVYDDRTADNTLSKYFNENGIVQVEQKGFNDL